MKKILLIVFIVSSLIITGCGNNQNDTAKKENETGKTETGSTENSAGNEVKKEEAGNENQTKTDNELGMKPGLPSNFPGDIPQPKNSKVLGSLTSSEGTVVTFESNDKVTDIVNFYKDEMKKNGYNLSEEGESLVSDKGGLINWSKGDKIAGLMLGYDKDKNITSLVITYK
ncbi:MAG: hypothetical protein JSS91_09330 [Bacteroidetes bacterium]|nr:hypothetical protein [Bacteroidota bacterium]